MLSRKLNIIFYTLILLVTISAQTKKTNYMVTDYGAIGDGVNLNTKAIQSTINDCYNHGGGVVVFPAGKFLTGSLDLKSNVELHLSPGAVLLGSTNISDYSSRVPELKSYNDVFLEYALIYAEKQNNIAITGSGTVDGQGSQFIITTKVKPDRYRNRPFCIRFVQCENVRVEDVTLQNSAMWMQQYLACNDVYIKGIRVINHANKNNDMIDIDGSSNVVMTNCIGDTDDDAITLKSTSVYPTENVTITNCIVSSHCNAIKFGTESIGGFRNITISNIVVRPSRKKETIYGYPAGISGLTLASVDGGNFEGVTISNIRIEGTQVPIYLRLGNRGRTVREGDPKPEVANYNDVKISHVIATGVTSAIGCSITGIPNHPIKNVTLSDISIEFAGGGNFEDAQKEIPELEDHYPESTKWGRLPSYGFFVRHVENISFEDISLTYAKKDNRPAMVFDDVKDVTLSGFYAEANKETESLITLNNVEDVFISNSKPLEKTNLFLKVNGEKSKNIRLVGNDFANVNKAVEATHYEEVLEQYNLK